MIPHGTYHLAPIAAPPRPSIAAAAPPAAPQSRVPQKDVIERAIKHTYDAEKGEWTKHDVLVIIQQRPFQQGCMRTAHHMWEVEEDGCRCAFVAKFTKTAVTAESIFEDAKLSMISQMYADMFNRVSNVDKKVAFLPSYVLILQDRGNKLCCSEPILHGEYVKHNNNDGAVATARLVPQAFSHFTWEASKHKLLICDIQGVGDYYTDPQILSADGHGFGQGNCGMESIVKFFKTHQCSDLCREMKLPSVADTFKAMNLKNAYVMPTRAPANHPPPPPTGGPGFDFFNSPPDARAFRQPAPGHAPGHGAAAAPPGILPHQMSPPRSDAPRQPPLPPPGLNYPQQRHQPHPFQPIQNPYALQHRAAHSQQPPIIGEAEAVAALAAIEERKEQERAQRQLKEDEELARRLAAQDEQGGGGGGGRREGGGRYMDAASRRQMEEDEKLAREMHEQMVLLERATASQRGGGQRVTAPSPPPGIQGVQRRGSVTEIPSPAAAQERRGVLMSPGGAGEADDDERLAWEIHMNEVNAASQSQVQLRPSEPV